MPALLGEPTIINVTLDAGSNFEIFIDVGDGTVLDHWYADRTHLPATGFNYTYSSAGYHPVSIWVTNDLTYLVYNLSAHVGHPPESFDVTAPNVVTGTPVSFSLTLTGGSRVTLSSRYGDGSPTAENFYTNYTDVPTLLTKSYGTGAYTTVWRVSNDFGFVDKTVLVYVSDTMVVAGANINLTALSTDVYGLNFTDTMQVVVAFSAGTHLTCHIDYGGADSAVGALDAVGDIVFTYTFTDTCAFKVDLTCSNPVTANFTKSMIVIVEVPVLDYALNIWLINTTRLETGGGFGVELLAGLPPTGAVVSYILFTPGNDIVPLDLNLTQKHIIQIPAPDYGYYDIQIHIYNNVSELHQAYPQTRIGVPIVGAAFTYLSPAVIASSDEVAFQAHVDAGSDVTYIIDQGDGTSSAPTPRTATADWTAADDTTIRNIYSTGGQYSVTLNATNYFGTSLVPLVVPSPLNVYTRITGVAVQVAPAVGVGQGATFTASVATGSLVTCGVDFGDGSPPESQPFGQYNASGAASLIYTHTFNSPAIYTVTFIFSNPAHSVNHVVPTTVQVPVGAVQLAVAANPAPFGDGTVAFTVRETANLGPTAASCELSFGDGQTQVFPAPGLASLQSETFSHVYQAAAVGILNVTANCSNLISQDSSSVSFVLQKEVTLPTVTASPSAFVRTGSGVTLVLSAGTGSHLHAQVDFAHGTAQAVTFTDPLTASVVHTYTTPGVYAAKISIYNGVSMANVTLDITVQNPVTVVDLTASSVNIVYPPGDVTFTLTLPASVTNPPTSVFLEWTAEAGVASVIQQAPGLSTVGGSHPYAFSYSGNTIGAATVLVNVSNMVSFVEKQISVNLQVGIEGASLALVSAVNYFNVSESVAFTATVTKGTNVTMKLVYGDGQSDTQHFPDSSTATTHQYTHAFATPQNYSVSLETSNPASVLTATLPNAQKVIVQNPIKVTDLQLKVTGFADKVIAFPTGDGTFDLKVLSGKPEPTDVKVDLQFGDSNGAVKYPGWAMQSLHQYTGDVLGAVNITATLTNLVSAAVINEQIDVQQVVVSPVLKVPAHAQVGVDIKAIVSITKGTDVYASLTFGDSLGATNTKITLNAGTEVTHLFGAAGQYIIKGTVSNKVSNIDLPQQVITLQHAIANLKVTSNSPITMGTVGQLTLSTKHDAANPTPAGVTVVLHPGGGANPLTYSAQDLSTDPTFSWDYSTTGHYTALLNVSNLVSHQVYSFDVVVAQIVAGVSFSVKKATSPAAGRKKRDTYDVIRDVELSGRQKRQAAGAGLVFTLGEELEFTASIASGSEVFYNWTFTAADTVHTQLSVTKYIFNQIGSHAVSLTAYNPVTQGVTISKTIQIISAMSITGILKNDSVIHGQPSLLGITLSAAVPDICVKFHITSVTPTFLFTRFMAASAGQCDFLLDFDATLFEVTPPTDQYLVINTLLIGTYTYQITSVIKGSTPAIQSGQLQVVSLPCSSPTVTPKFTEGLTRIKPKPIKKANELLLESATFNTMVNCQRGTKVIVSWAIKGVDPVTGDMAPLPSTDTLFDINTASFFAGGSDRRLPARAFNIGVFEIQFKVEMVVDLEKFAVGSIFVSVVGSPIATGLVGGEYNTVGHNKIVPVDAASLTKDPDESPGTFSYTYTCWRLDEQAAMKDVLLAEMKAVTIPTDLVLAAAWKGGCFGAGPGRLTETAGAWQLNTGLMEPKTAVQLCVQARIDTRTASACQTIDVQEGDPPQLSFTCSGPNCGKKINSQVQFKMVSSCTTCVVGRTPTYKWTLRDDFAGSDVLLPSYASEVYDLGMTTSLMLKKDFMQIGRSYTLTLVGAVIGMATAKKVTSIYTNKPPEQGSCSTNPASGEALQRFNINCLGWLDDGENIPVPDNGPIVIDPTANIKFVYSYTLQGVTTTISTSDPKLPTGPPGNNYNYVIEVRISDMYATYAVYPINVQVKPPTDKNAVTNMAASLTKVDISVAKLDLSKNLADMVALVIMVDVVPVVQPTITFLDPRQQAAQQRQAAIDLRRAEAEAKKQKDAVMSSMMLQFSMLAKPPADPKDALTSAQVMATLAGLSSISGKLDVQAPVAAKESSLQATQELGRSIASMPADQKDAAMQNLMSSVSNTVANIDLKVVPPPVNFAAANQDVALSEVQQIALEKAAADQRKQTLGLTKAAASAMEQTAKNIAAAARGSLILNQQVTLNTKELGIQLIRTSTANLAQKKFTGIANTDVKFAPASLAGVAARQEPGDTLVFQMTVSAKLVYSYDQSAKHINTPTIVCSLTDQDNAFVPLHGMADPLVVGVQADEATQNKTAVNATGMVQDESTGAFYVGIPIVDGGGDAMVIELQPEDVMGGFGFRNTGQLPVGFELYIKLKANNVSLDKPNATFHDLHVTLPNETFPVGDLQRWTYIISQTDAAPPGVYIGVLPIYTNDSASSPRVRRAAPNPAPTAAYNTTEPNFALKTVLSSCRVWDTDKQKWLGGNCQVGGDSTVGKTNCQCSDLLPSQRTYAGGFTVPTVNKINFNNIFSNFAKLLAGNPTVFAVVIVMLLIYVLLALWARHSDRKDVEKWGVRPLLDNYPGHRVTYKLVVYTGVRRGAGTDSVPSFIISGDGGDTGIRVLEDGNVKHFDRGSVRNFVMTTDVHLGALTYLRVWHNNGGKGAKANWFLDKVEVEDLQGQQRYFFLCGQWMAVDEGDGLIDRILPVANQDEVKGFQHLFYSKTRKSFFDDHLWFSVASRPTRSNFTRLQRLTCILMLVFTSMITNAMFYKADQVAQDQSIVIGPLILSAATMLTSLFSALCLVPINILIVMLFRKSRPKGWKDVDDDEVGEDLDDQGEDDPDAPPKPPKKKRWWRQKYPLPYWCSYVAWAVAILTTLVAAAFVIFYSLEWGKVKSEEWLSSLVLATIQSVILIQPFKIILLAMVLTVLFRTLEEDEEKADEHTNGKAAADEELEREDPIIAMERLKLAARNTTKGPPSDDKLAVARTERQFDKRMWAMVSEGVYYFCFLMLLCFIAWGQKSVNLFRLQQRLLAQFDGGYGSLNIKQVTDGHKFWNWTETVLIPNLFWMNKYDGQPNTLRDRKYLGDSVFFRVGAARMRQVRMVPGTCNVVPQMRVIAKECTASYGIFSEQDKNYTTGWVEVRNDTVNSQTSLTPLEKPWRFFGMLELMGIPYWGWLNTYGAGGYVAEFGTSELQARRVVSHLRANDWVDYYTRAVFVEFTVYNPNINLFAYVNILMEFPPLGGVYPFPRVLAFQVYQPIGGMSTVVIIAELVYCCIILYFLITEAIKFNRLPKEYFKDPWNTLQVTVISLSIAAIGMFAMREMFGRLVMDSLKKNIEGYTNYMALAQYDELFMILISVIVFLATINFLRLLRFSKHVAHFSGAMKLARKDLVSFGVLFTITMIAFTSWAFLLFGPALQSYASFFTTAGSLYSMLIGKFSFKEMKTADRVMGPWFFVLYSMVVFFVLVNIFLGIIGVAYYEVRMKPHLIGDDYQVVGFMRSKLRRFMHRKDDVTPLGEGYVDPIDSLGARLDSLDTMVTKEYRKLLGLQPLTHDPSAPAPSKSLKFWGKQKGGGEKSGVTEAWT